MKIAVAAVAAFACAAQAQTEAAPLPMNHPVTVAGITVACTGIGMDQQNNPLWSSYPVRVELTNQQGQYTAGANVTLAKADGQPMAQFRCPASWVLFNGLPAGSYKVTATIAPGPGGTESAEFRPPATGQKRVELRFSATAAE